VWGGGGSKVVGWVYGMVCVLWAVCVVWRGLQKAKVMGVNLNTWCEGKIDPPTLLNKKTVQQTLQQRPQGKATQRLAHLKSRLQIWLAKRHKLSS
jgi:hypothetical protein